MEMFCKTTRNLGLILQHGWNYILLISKAFITSSQVHEVSILVHHTCMWSVWYTDVYNVTSVANCISIMTNVIQDVVRMNQNSFSV